MPVNNDRPVRSNPRLSDTVHVTRSSEVPLRDGSLAATTGGPPPEDVVTASGTATAAETDTARRRRVTPTTLPPNASVSLRAAAGADILPGVVGSDGTLFPQASGDDRLQKVNALAFRDATASAPFDAITDAGALQKIATKLAAQHAGLCAQPQNEGEALAMRAARAAALRLLNDATIRAQALGGGAVVDALLKITVDVIRSEPFKDSRDFAWDALISHAEAKAIPEVKEARELLYPGSMPYAQWPKRVQVVRYVDESGSLFADNVDILREIGFRKVKENADGSWVFLLKKQGGKHEVEMLLKPAPPNHEKPKVAEHLGTPPPHVIEVCMHAGYGNFMDAALAAGTRGTGAGQVMCAYQCWSEGNIETLKRNASDVQYFGTTSMTSDWYDGIMQKNIMLGIVHERSWDQIMGLEPDPAKAGQKRDTGKGAIAELKELLKEDGEHAPEHWESHFFAPNKREIFAKKIDRDRDGTIDANDPAYNVTYPKRIDAAGGFDPVVQSIPKYALDGTNLTKCVQQLNRAIEYNHMLPPAIEAKLPWKGASWQAAGFFDPGVANNRAFHFVPKGDGTIDVQLSTRFAHGDAEDLSRMLGVELGFWLGGQADAAVQAMSAAERAALPAPYRAGVPETIKGALGIAFLERFAEQQGSFFSERGVLDEAWAEEALLGSRYGLAGFTVGALRAEMDKMLGEHGDYLPAQFARVLELVQGAPGLDTLAAREPTRVGAAISVPAGVALDRDASDLGAQVKAALHKLGVSGTVLAIQPSWLTQGQAQNIVVTVQGPGKREVLSLGVGVDGSVQAAARLPLNFDAKIDAAAKRVLESLADNGGPEHKQALLDMYARARATLAPTDALASALLGARPLLVAGASVDLSDAFWDLTRAGLVTQREVSQLARAAARIYPQGANATAEKSVMAFVDKLAGDGAGATRARTAYFAEVVSIGGPEGRALGLLRALESMPARRASVTDAELTTAVDTVLSSGLLAIDQRDDVLRLLLKQSGGDPATAVVVAFEEMVKDRVWNLDAELKTAIAAGKSAVATALAAGSSPVDAVTVGLDTIHKTSSISIGADSLLGYGIIDARDPTFVDASKRFVDASEIRLAERALLEVCSGVAGARKLYFDAVTANGGDRLAAAKDLAEKVPSGLSLDASAMSAIAQLDPARSPVVLDVLFDKAGQKRSEWVAQQLGRDQPSVADAYKQAIEANQGHKAALMAALLPAAAAGDLSSIDNIRSDVFATAAEHREVLDKAYALRPQAELATAVRAVAVAIGMPVDDRRIRDFEKKSAAALAASGDLVDEALRFLGTLRAPVGTRIELSPQLLARLPFDKRKPVAEALARAGNTDVAEVAFRGAMASFSGASAAQIGAARTAFDAGARAGDLGDAVIAAWASLSSAGVTAEGRPTIDVLSHLGLVEGDRLAAVEAKAALVVGQPAAMIAALAVALGPVDAATVEASAKQTLAGGTVADAIREMLRALARPTAALVDAVAIAEALGPALAGADPQQREKLAAEVAHKVGLSLDDVRRALVVGRIDATSADMPNLRLIALYDATAKDSGAAAAAAALLTINDLVIDRDAMGPVELARTSGLFTGAALSSLVAAEARRVADGV